MRVRVVSLVRAETDVLAVEVLGEEWLAGAVHVEQTRRFQPGRFFPEVIERRGGSRPRWSAHSPTCPHSEACR